MADKYLLLKAEEHNWGLVGPGSWTTTIWRIYSDRSYTKEKWYNLESEQIELIIEEKGYQALRNRNNREKCKKSRGMILQKNFEQLLNTIAADLWRDPDILSEACDGVAWRIKQFDSDHAVVKSSGDLGYIYGQPVLESIVELFP